MKIRKAKESDYEELMKLYNIFVGEDRYSRHDNDSFKKVLDLRDSYILVAEQEGEAIGFVTFSVRTVVRYPKPIAELDELFVVEEFRKHGVGGMLIEEVENAAKERQCYRVYIGSADRFETAHTFYVGQGYTKYGYHFYKNL